jgi:hypothetical protein
VRAVQVRVPEVALAVAEAADDEHIPERVELASLLIHGASEVGVELGGGLSRAVVHAVLVDPLLLQELQNLLVVGELAVHRQDGVA